MIIKGFQNKGVWITCSITSSSRNSREKVIIYWMISGKIKIGNLVIRRNWSKVNIDKVCLGVFDCNQSILKEIEVFK